MAESYLAEIRTVQPEGPYYLGGYCAGAYVALEMAVQLRRQGEEVALLASFNTAGDWKPADSLMRGLGYHWRNLQQMNMSKKLAYLSVSAPREATKSVTSASRKQKAS